VRSGSMRRGERPSPAPPIMVQVFAARGRVSAAGGENLHAFLE
jgi:hypothetical protein